jgi:hypothetical protein
MDKRKTIHRFPGFFFLQLPISRTRRCPRNKERLEFP